MARRQDAEELWSSVSTRAGRRSRARCPRDALSLANSGWTSSLEVRRAAACAGASCRIRPGGCARAWIGGRSGDQRGLRSRCLIRTRGAEDRVAAPKHVTPHAVVTTSDAGCSIAWPAAYDAGRVAAMLS